MNIRLSCKGTRIENASWSDVLAGIEAFKEEGVLILTIEPSPASGPIRLYIESEDGYYLPSMLIRGGRVEMFLDEDAGGGEHVSIGGYDYDPMLVTQDFELIKEMIQEFYRRGNVSSDLWHPRKKKVTDNILFKLWRLRKKSSQQ